MSDKISFIPEFNFRSTGIGSVPFLDIETTCRDILENFPEMPFWPQFVNRSYLEDMSVQYSEGLPMLVADESKRSLVLDPKGDSAGALTAFYEHFLAGDSDYFAISEEYAPGLYTMLNLIQQEPENKDLYIKGQSVGPITFAMGIQGPDGKSVLHHSEILEALVNGLAIKLLWQVRALEKCGRKPIVFLDEPGLSGFGSAFSSIQRREVLDLLGTVIGYIKDNSDALVGIHCCGNTDWSMIMEAGPHIINFDAFEYMESFFLYPDDIVRFFKNGGSLAWGVVPTSKPAEEVTVETLYLKMEKGFESVRKLGVDPEMLAERSILTPACGMGTMDPESAKKSMALPGLLGKKLRSVV